MDTSGITSSTSEGLGLSAYGNSNLDKDAFMTLLVQQLKHQDPMEPTSNQDFIAQLASFSSLEEIESMNENIVGMTYLQQSNALLGQLTNSSNLIGKQVTYIDPTSLEEATGTVQKVKVENGEALLDVNGKDIPLTYLKEVGPGITTNEQG